MSTNKLGSATSPLDRLQNRQVATPPPKPIEVVKTDSQARRNIESRFVTPPPAPAETPVTPPAVAATPAPADSTAKANLQGRFVTPPSAPAETSVTPPAVAATPAPADSTAKANLQGRFVTPPSAPAETPVTPPAVAATPAPADSTAKANLQGRFVTPPSAPAETPVTPPAVAATPAPVVAIPPTPPADGNISTELDHLRDELYKSLEQRQIPVGTKPPTTLAQAAGKARSPREIANEQLKPVEDAASGKPPAPEKKDSTTPKAKTKEENKPTAKAGARPEDPHGAKPWGGFSEDHAWTEGKHTQPWFDEHYIYNGTGPGGIKFHFNPLLYYTFQAHIDQPSLDTVALDEQVPLKSNSGGPFENPATGQLETVSRRVPARLGFEKRHSGTLELQTHTEFYELPQISFLKDVPYLNFFSNLHRGDLRVIGKVYALTQGDKSGHLKYEVDNYGAQFNQQTGDIDGYVNLKGKANTFDWNLYARYTVPDFDFRLPGLAWASDKFLGTRPMQLHEFNELDAEGKPKSKPIKDLVAKVLFNPTLSISVAYERKGETDGNKETEIIPPSRAIAVTVLDKDLGVFVKVGKGYDDSKLYFKEFDDFWVGWALPMKSIYSIAGLDTLANSLSTDLHFFKDKDGNPDPLGPKATADRLLFDEDKLSIAGVFRKYRNPQNPLLGELKPGQSEGPGGPDGSNVRASSQGVIAVATHTFNSKPFKNDIVNKIFADSRLSWGFQWMKMDIKGNDQDILTPLTGDGSTGSITTLTPASVNPNPAGTWWAASIDFEKNIAIGNMGYLKINPYFDVRRILGEVTDNSYSDKLLKTTGILVGYTKANGMTRSPTQL